MGFACLQAQGAREKVLKMRSRALLQQSPLLQGRAPQSVINAFLCHQLWFIVRHYLQQHVKCFCRGAMVRITLLAAGFVIGERSYPFTAQYSVLWGVLAAYR